MTQPVLILKHLSKTYITGRKKNAIKAQKAISKLQDEYDKNIDDGDGDEFAGKSKRLQRAKDLFADEQFEASYHEITGKRLKPRLADRGAVVHALTNVNLEIYPGEMVAIVGPSGSGKSTLLNMLGLLDQPTTGQIWIQGKNVTDIGRGELPPIRSSELGFVFQSFNLISTLSALENVMLPLRYAHIGSRERREKARSALDQVGLSDRLNHSPNELSGGQQQRVAIARSIVNEPSIIFGDELTGELDSKMTAEVMNLIVDLNQAGRTFVIVTHNPDVAKLCKRIISMKDGRIEHDSGWQSPARKASIML